MMQHYIYSQIIFIKKINHNIDVSNTTNIKVQFGVVNQAATDFIGNTNANKTTATFTRLGDT